MRTFSGRLWLIQDRHFEVGVEIALDDERIRITSNGTLIGEWPFEDVGLSRDGDDIHLFAEDEELVIASTDPLFAPAMAKPFTMESTADARAPEESESRQLGKDDETETEEPERPRRRSRRGAHRQPWSLKLRW